MVLKKLFPQNYNINQLPEDALFGFRRKFDIHTGIDLHCDHKQPVYSLEDGIIQKIELFTGSKVGSEWWNETFYVGVLGKSGYIVYGEILPENSLKIGDKIKIGTLLGHVETVLKKDKGRPMNMLHIELYSKVIDDPVIWKLDEEKPKELKNPNILFSLHKHK